MCLIADVVGGQHVAERLSQEGQALLRRSQTHNL